eukprot:TRINITY_DN18231_c0_g2_i1.p1 TRINITY_DN18231_c0_g2~~TRINITY_DN18231_c0_g2_i1.p1  ORF type:complete len:693 (-),score=245.36 TRINITY_DN18231_c0_g2_i1:129-2207(-)
MKQAAAVLVAASLVSAADAQNPVGKALELMNDLSIKITKDGEAELSAYRKYEQWCATAEQEQNFEIEDGKNAVEEADAAKSSGESAAGIASGKIEALSASIAKDEGDLADATRIRGQESDDYSASEKELVGTVDTLGRAINILQDQLAKKPALLQTKFKIGGNDKTALVATLNEVVQAAALSSDDAKSLQRLIQSDELSLGGPEAAAYDMQSHSIVDVLQDLEEKAEKELVELRQKEAAAKHNFDLLAQSLKDQVSVSKGELEEQKAAKATGDRKASAAKGEKDAAQKGLDEATKTLAKVKTSCKDTAESHEESKKSRAAEIDAIAVAVKALKESVGEAASRLYGAASFMQVSAITTPEALNAVEVETILRQVAEKDHSPAMAQLTRTVSKAARLGSGDFNKIAELINGMITRLEDEMKNDSGHKEYCDQELMKTSRKANKLQLSKEKFESRKDVGAAKITSLQNQMTKEKAQLAKLAEQQVEADKIRAEEKADYKTSNKDVELGLEGVRVAVKALRDYYRSRGAAFIQTHSSQMEGQPATPIFHSKAGGASTSIIGMLEVVESDMSKSLSTARMQEESAIREYQVLTSEIREQKAMKTQDVAYKMKAVAGLQNDLREHESDLSTAQTEIDATAKYLKEIEAACASNGPTYEERKAARELEISNLKEALTVIQSKEKGSLLQKMHSFLRGKK